MPKYRSLVKKYKTYAKVADVETHPTNKRNFSCRLKCTKKMISSVAVRFACCRSFISITLDPVKGKKSWCSLRMKDNKKVKMNRTAEELKQMS